MIRFNNNIISLSSSLSRTKIILVKPTTECNLKCKFCYYEIDNNLRSNKIANIEELKKKLIKLNLKKNDLVFLSGGEYLLYNKSCELAEFLHQKAYTILTTNGINIKKEKRILSLVDCVQVSLDSYFSSYHEAYRGFQKETISAIEALTNNNINTSIITTLNKKNIDDFPNVLEFALTNKVRSIFVQLLWLPLKHKSYDEFVLSRDELGKLTDIILLLEKNQERIKIPNLNYLNLLSLSLKNTLDDYFVENCFGRKQFFIINPDTRIHHCMPTKLYNNFNTAEENSIQVEAINKLCNLFSLECLCFFGQISMEYTE